MNYKEPKRGDIFYVAYSKNFNDAFSSDTTGRPAVIVSDDHLNRSSDYVEVVYLTTKTKKTMPTHSDVYCKSQSTALCETIHTVSKDKLGTYVRTVSDDEMGQIEHALMCSLGITQSPGKAQIERDMYKRLYYELLERIVG